MVHDRPVLRIRGDSKTRTALCSCCDCCGRRRKMPSSSSLSQAHGFLTKSGICSDCASVVPYTAHRAAISGHLDCLKLCVQRGCKLTSRNGDTLLHVAAKHGQLECFKWIAAHCKSLSMADANSKGNTVAHCVMDGGSVECAVALFKHVSGRETPLISDHVNNLMAMANLAGMTPVLVSVVYNRLDVIRWLASIFGADLPGVVNHQVGGASAFHYAAAVGSVEVLSLLHEHLPALANLAVPQTGKRPIHLAVHTGHLGAAQFLHKVTSGGLQSNSADGMNCFHQAVQNGHLDCLEWLVKETLSEGGSTGSCLLQVDKEQASLFHFAAAFGETKCMQYLLRSVPDNTAAVAMRDVWNRTPLHDAAEKNHLNCFKLLLAAGADIYAKDDDGNTPYALAMSHNKLRAYINHNMHSDSSSVPAKPPKAPRKNVANGTPNGASAASSPDGVPGMFTRGSCNHRASVRYKQQAEGGLVASFLPSKKTSTTGAEHTYAAVTVSTSASTSDCELDGALHSPPTETPLFGADEATSRSPSPPEAAAHKQRSARALSSSGASSPPGVSSPSLAVQQPQERERSASVGCRQEASMVTVRPPAEQPSVKIIHASSAATRITHEVNKLAFALSMTNVTSCVVKLKKDTLSSQKVADAASLLRWLEAEKEGFGTVIIICTSELLEIFTKAEEGKKKKQKDKGAASASDATLALPASLQVAIMPVVTLHGASSRFRPHWATGSSLYWPKNQPAMFARMSICMPEQRLSLPTRRLRAGTF